MVQKMAGPNGRSATSLSEDVGAAHSLEELQRRHARMMSVAGDVNAETLSGVASDRRLVEDDGRDLSIDSPAGDFDGPIAELHGHTGDQGDDGDDEDDPFAND